MRHHTILAGVAALTAFYGLPATAQQSERYQMERTPDGYVRLDTQTGAMTLCRETDARLTCSPATQSGTTTGELAELSERVKALESRIAGLEGRAPAAGLPPDEEFERGIGYMERFFRMFMGLVREFEGEPTPPESLAPDRT